MRPSLPPTDRTPAVTALSTREVESALSRSVLDGVLYAAMVGVGESYFVADAIRLGATPVELGLVITLPLMVGSLGPATVLRLLKAMPRRRPLVVAGAFGQALVLLLALALGDGLGALTPPLLIAALCVYQFCGQAAGTAWSSWYGDLVPGAIRGTWFARRTRLVHLATFLGLLCGGILLHVLQGGAGAAWSAGFVVVFAAAGVFRLCSTAVLWRSPEPPFRGISTTGQLTRFLATGRGRNAARLLVGGAVFHVTVYMASPYFAPFMLDVLQLGYLGYMAAIASQVAIKVLAMPYWGRLVDRFGPRHAWGGAIFLAALVPLPWLFVGGLGGAISAQLLSGFAWGGYEVALFALLLHSTGTGSRPTVFAAQSMFNAIGQLSGSMAGAALLAAHGYAWAFGVSLAGRLVIALTLPRLVKDLRPAGAPRRPPLLMRILGFRPGAGIAHRPMLDPSNGAEPANPAADTERREHGAAS